MTWKEASVAKHEVLLQHLHRGPEKNHASIHEDNMSRALSWTRHLPESEETLSGRPRPSVTRQACI